MKRLDDIELKKSDREAIGGESDIGLLVSAWFVGAMGYGRVRV